MGFPIDVQEFENCINKDNFNKTVFNSKIYYLVKCNFALVATLEDFVGECDRNDNEFVIENRGLWLEFLQIYYHKLNVSRNILKAILRDGIIEDRDTEFINDTIQWTIESIQYLLKDNGKQPLYFANIIFAGRFYSSLHYYIGAIDSFCEKKLNLVQEYIQSRRNLKIIEEERQWIDSLYEDLQQRKIAGEDVQLTPDIHNKLTTMWYRTLDFVENELIPEINSIAV